MTKTGATLPAHHVGAREVALTHLKHQKTTVFANAKEALEYVYKSTNCEERHFTASNTEADPRPPFALHLLKSEWSRQNAHCKSDHSNMDFRETCTCRTACCHHACQNDIKPSVPCPSSHATESKSRSSNTHVYSSQSSQNKFDTGKAGEEPQERIG